MKKTTALFLVLMLAIIAVFAQDIEYSISVAANTPTTISPPRKGFTIDAAWTTNTAVTNGTFLYCTSNSLTYMVLETGTTDAASTNYPTATSGQTETNGSAVLVHCYDFPRKKLVVTQEGNAGIWYQTGMSANTNGGGEFAYVKGTQYVSDSDEATTVVTDGAVKLNIRDK